VGWGWEGAIPVATAWPVIGVQEKTGSGMAGTGLAGGGRRASGAALTLQAAERASGPEEDRMRTPGRRRIGWGRAEEVAARGVDSRARTAVRRQERWPSARAGGQARMVTGLPGGQATMVACKRAWGPTVVVVRCRRRWVIGGRAVRWWRWRAAGGDGRQASVRAGGSGMQADGGGGVRAGGGSVGEQRASGRVMGREKIDLVGGCGRACDFGLSALTFVGRP
jgi:hypothetical protein